jgi:aminoglycoside phosphotransferase (APT) family kinase protein
VTVGGDHQPDALLDLVNREHRAAWRLAGRLPGGRKTGAWEVEGDGGRAVLKRLDWRCPRAYLDDLAALLGRARSRGWPAPAWHAWGLDGDGHPYTLAELLEGEHPRRLDGAVLDALLDVVERQRGIAARSAVHRADAWQSVFGDGSRWRSVLDRHSPGARAAGEAIARLVAPYRDVELAGADLVHTDFGLHNVLVRDGRAAAVVDVEGAGRGAAAIDLASLLMSAHGDELAEDRVLDRLIAHGVAGDGAAVFAVCLAHSLFDWAIYATGGWEADRVIAYLERAATLCERIG